MTQQRNNLYIIGDCISRVLFGVSSKAPVRFQYVQNSAAHHSARIRICCLQVLHFAQIPATPIHHYPPPQSGPSAWQHSLSGPPPPTRFPKPPKPLLKHTSSPKPLYVLVLVLSGFICELCILAFAAAPGLMKGAIQIYFIFIAVKQTHEHPCHCRQETNRNRELHFPEMKVPLSK